MTDSLVLLGFTFLVFVASVIIVLAGYGLLQGRRTPAKTTPLHLRHGGDLQQVRVLQQGRLSWVLQCPAALEELEIGSMIQLQSAGRKGLSIFQANVTAYDASRKHLYVTPPQRCLLMDRREEPRERPSDSWATIEDKPGRVVDLSTCGARMSCSEPLEEGERVCIDFPNSPHPLFGWVLDCNLDEAEATSASVKWQVRVLFEERVPVSKLVAPKPRVAAG